MKGVIIWKNANGDYDLDRANFDTETDQCSLRDTMVTLLSHDWDTFGEDGDCIVIKREEEE